MPGATLYCTEYPVEKLTDAEMLLETSTFAVAMPTLTPPDILPDTLAVIDPPCDAEKVTRFGTEVLLIE